MKAATRKRQAAPRGAAPRRKLSRERIVDAALEVVDDVGLPGLNMRRLAAHVGAKPMSLYRHIPSKDTLLDAIAERIMGDLTIPDLTTGDAYASVIGVVRAFRSKLLEHPNALPLFTGARASAGTLLQLEALEAVLRGAAATGIDPATAMDALAIVLAFVLGSVAREVTTRGVFGVTPDTIGPQKDAAGLPPDRFPHLVALAEDFPAEKFDDLFERGLLALLAGLLMSLPDHVARR
jgi:TetR/AcrR family tetracycline transcriptional repressor